MIISHYRGEKKVFMLMWVPGASILQSFLYYNNGTVPWIPFTSSESLVVNLCTFAVEKRKGLGGWHKTWAFSTRSCVRYPFSDFPYHVKRKKKKKRRRKQGRHRSYMHNRWSLDACEIACMRHNSYRILCGPQKRDTLYHKWVCLSCFHVLVGYHSLSCNNPTKPWFWVIGSV